MSKSFTLLFTTKKTSFQEEISILNIEVLF